MSEPDYDVVIVGAGIVGAIIAKELTAAGKSVLILEAGRATGLANDEFRSYETYRSYVENYQNELIKIPNSPYPRNPNAPSSYATDGVKIDPGAPDLVGYEVQTGPYPFMSSFLRQQGGTTLHWMADCPRMVPSDFQMNNNFGVGRNWPVSYEDLMDDYARAEWEIGVAADVKEQEFAGVTFGPGYDYPIESMPKSYLDQWLGKHIDGMNIEAGGYEFRPEVRGLPAARNGIPRNFPVEDRERGFPWNDSDYVHEVDGRIYYRLRGAVGAPHIGLRCEGNSSCTPICPVQAKYSALKTLARLDTKLCKIKNQSVASTLELDSNGRISRVNYLTYETEGLGGVPCSVTAKMYVLATHAIENAKILLASGVANSSDQVGRNLMDHPYFMTWALAKENVGAFRGPGYTSGIPAFRDGDFRKSWAAFRLDIGNWGWNFSAFSPASDVAELLGKNIVGKTLRSKLAQDVPRQLRLGFQLEQLPSPGNRVTVSDDYRDAMGLHRPVVAYDLSDYTWESMVKGIQISNQFWDKLGIENENRFHLGGGLHDAGLPTYKEFGDEKLAFYGSGHIIGTHRMGVSRTDSVVDSHQRSWDHDNLYIAGCGSHPTTGTANPTPTTAALAFRSARHMLQHLK